VTDDATMSEQISVDSLSEQISVDSLSEQISVDSWYRRTPFGVNADVGMSGVWCLVTSRPYSARCR
jgi:hypothetical protein